MQVIHLAVLPIFLFTYLPVYPTLATIHNTFRIQL